MRDDERADGGQLRERVRPGPGSEVPGKIVQHVVASMVAERHKERGEEGRAVGALVEASAQALGRVHEDVVSAAL